MDLGPLVSFPEGSPVLRKPTAGSGATSRRFVCVRSGDAVHALDDRCPHQGYPLSQGSVRDGVLTCEWHNWKFDLQTGGCLFGGEPVRRYPTRVVEGRVHLDTTLDVSRESERFVAGIRAALLDDDPARALREALRLGALTQARRGRGLGDLKDGLGVLALDGAERAQWGFDHGLALLADTCTWVSRGWIDAAEAFVAAAAAVAEPSRNRSPRPVIARDVDRADEPNALAEDLIAERREDAESRVRHLVRTRGALATARAALVPYVSRRLLDYGHGTIFLAKALELEARFPRAAEALMAAVTLQLAWATDELALPPFTTTREAVVAVDGLAPSPRPSPSKGAGRRARDFDRPAYEAAVLEGERAGVDATLAALREGGDPVALLRAIGHAAAVRLARFDRAWEERTDAEVGVLDVTHAVTFVDAAIALATGQPFDVVARFAVVAAGFVGKLRKADTATVESSPSARDASAGASLIDAVRARDVVRARSIADTLDAEGRRTAYRDIAPFAAFEAAVRPIFYAHTVKTTEALRRLEENDPEADGVYLRACVSYVVPRRRERAFARTAAIARSFLANGRPPVGLY